MGQRKGKNYERERDHVSLNVLTEPLALRGLKLGSKTFSFLEKPVPAQPSGVGQEAVTF